MAMSTEADPNRIGPRSFERRLQAMGYDRMCCGLRIRNPAPCPRLDATHGCPLRLVQFLPRSFIAARDSAAGCRSSFGGLAVG